MHGRIKGKILDFNFSYNGAQRVTIEITEGDFRDTYDALHDVPVDLAVKKWRDKRSLDANAYMWVLIDKLAVATGVRKKELYFDALRNVGGNTEHYCAVPKAIDALCDLWSTQGSTGWGWPFDRYPSKVEGCENVKLYYGSSTFDTATMARLINHLIEDCMALNIETMPPEELASLLGES